MKIRYAILALAVMTIGAQAAELSHYERLARHQPREQLKQELKRLDQLKKKGEISEAEHEESMRKVLKTHISS